MSSDSWSCSPGLLCLRLKSRLPWRVLGGERGDRVDLVLGQADACGVEVLVQVRDTGGSGYRERGGRVVQLPGQGDLLRRDVVLGGDGVDHGVERLAVGAAWDGGGVPG